MQRYVLIAALVVMCAPFLLAGKKGGNNMEKGHGGGGEKGPGGKANKQCQWKFGPCQVNGDATCGLGYKIGTAASESCAVTEKQFKCRVPCKQVSGAGGEGGMAGATGKSDCKYKKVMSQANKECDPVTKKKTITLVLKKKSPATCEPTKTILKDCKVKGERPSRKNKNKPKFHF